MRGLEFFTSYPSRILHVGVGVLSGFALLAGIFMLPIVAQPRLSFPRKAAKVEESKPLPPLFADQLQPRSFEFDGAACEDRFVVALCPGRPDHIQAGPVAHVKIKGSNQVRQIPLPGKAGLLFDQKGDLAFGGEEDRFWLELGLESDGTLKSSIALEYEDTIRNAHSRRQPSAPIVQKMEDLPQEGAFQVLSKARWLGSDLVSRLGGGETVQKIEIGLHLLDVPEGGRIYWDGLRWANAALPADGRGAPLAVVKSATALNLELDVWDGLGERYIRVAAPFSGFPQARAKAEDGFSSIRIRSEKQISCLLEKQCLVLREGDWVLKENGRWRVLRKSEEKQQMIQGKRVGDLIVLDSIDAKRRLVQGQLILANRVHGFPISLSIAGKAEKKLPLPSDAAARVKRAS